MTTHRMSATIAAKLAFDVIAAAVDYLKDRESEVTQREYIRAHRDVLVTALEKEVLLDYFEKRFAERREALEQFYVLLHTAVETADPQLASWESSKKTHWGIWSRFVRNGTTRSIG